MRVAVAGGTGLVGRHVVEELGRTGHEPVILARSNGIDLTSGVGVDAALAGVEVVIDVTDVKSLSRKTATSFFEAATRQLLCAEQRIGVRHHVLLSIVGIDDVKTGYYRAKRHQEELALGGQIPVTILRATQFHEFPAQTLTRTKLGPVAFMPRMRSQPIAVREVAAALAKHATGQPAGRLPDLAGPKVEEMTELARRFLHARGRHGAVVPLRLPGAAGTAMAAGGLLPHGDGPRGSQTFDQWLASPDAKAWL